MKLPETIEIAVFEKDKEEILQNLSRQPKSLPSKYFYDKRGSELFEEICALDEYYPTKAEISIVRNNIDEITELLGPGLELIEFGSGSSLKTRLLLDHLEHIEGYIPVDISGDFLEKEAAKLQKEYPDLQIKPLVLDYTRPFELPEDTGSHHKVIYFPGSTIGNFEPAQAKEFLAKCAGLVGKRGGLLIGVDTKKDPDILEAAYNDSKGITAAFNKNLLERLNREFGANFNPDSFRHQAVYNKSKGRIEMHLVSMHPQTVTVAGKNFTFEEGETIHTENSYKYSPEEFENLASEHFSLKKTWMDENQLFGFYYLESLV